MPTPLKTFIIYASADRDLRRQLERQLKSLVDNGFVQLWSDKEILPGEVWDSAIKKQLLEAELFLMLISTDFFNSNYIREAEFTAALHKLERGEAIVIPIIVRDCDWEVYPEVQKLQVLPQGGVPVTDLEHWKTQDKAWAEVTRAIRRRIETLRFDQEQQAQTLRIEQERLEHERREQERLENERLQREREAAEKPSARQEKVLQQHNTAGSGSIPKRTVLQQIVLALGGVFAASMIWFLLIRPTDQNNQAVVESTQNKMIHPATENNIPTRKSGLEMVAVQGGTFDMGGNIDKDEKPIHKVTLSSFAIGKYEVTLADWFDVMGTKPLNFANCDDCPIEQISWNDVQDFLTKLNARYPGKRYRLPTEAEWEYAARGGALSKEYEYAGSNDSKGVAWYFENSNSKTHPVGEKKANELGLHDMSGNVWEWCSDWYGAYAKAPQTNPAGLATGDSRVIRGGSWDNPLQCCRIAYRHSRRPGARYDNLGFRLVLQ